MVDDQWPGYRTDSDGKLLRAADGHCWRTTEWAKELAVPECDVSITGQPQVVAEFAPEHEPEPEEPTVAARPGIEPLSITFDFDSSTLSEDKLKALEAWHQQVSEMESAVIEIHGYSDPLGAASYNLRLSKQRVEKVSQWWQRQAERAPSLRVMAHGEDSSVTGQGCKGKRGDVLKDCHKPDRRVTLLLVN